MKKIVMLLLLVIALIVPSVVLAAEQPVKVIIGGEQIQFDEQPFIEEGVTLVQFRPLFEKLGLNIKWDNETRKIIGTKSGLEISLQIDNKVATVNGENIILEIAPKIINGNTVVPLRFVGESTNNEVSWDQATNQVSLKANSLTSSEDTNKDYNFRNTKWGMTKDEVKKSESLKVLTEDETFLVYSGNNVVSNYSAKIAYQFSNKKLTHGGYSIDSPSIIRFNDLKEQLIKKYGKPSADTEEMYKGLYGENYKIDFDKVGKLSEFAQWKMNDTEISLSIKGKDNSISSLMIMYKDASYSPPKSNGEGL